MNLSNRAVGLGLQADRIKKMYLMLVILLLFTTAPFYFLAQFLQSLRRTETELSLKHIGEAAQALKKSGQPVTDELIVQKVHELYPREVIKDGKVLDSWHSPLSIRLFRVDHENSGQVRIVILSSGSDQIAGNEDDIKLERVLSTDPR